MYNVVEELSILSFIILFECDDLFGKFLEYHNSTIDEYYDFYDLDSSSDINCLMSDIFDFLYDLNGCEEIVSYSREKGSSHLEIHLLRSSCFKDYLLTLPVTIDSRSFDEYYGKAVLSVC